MAGRLKLEQPENSVNHGTIYLYIFKKELELTIYLVCGRKRRRKRIQKRVKRVMIPHRTGIEERPEHINSREDIGHWEADTSVSRQSKEAIMVLQERKLGITCIEKLPRCAPKEMKNAIYNRLALLPPELRKSITFNNGQENRHHNVLREELNIDTFFCNPYSSWEKGSVENAIGLTRRVWPKKTDYALIPDEDIAKLEYRLNTRPKKRFGFLSPFEMLCVALTP
ncbi:MAG: IS30 family transposase [Spirochaetales bacterium]|nr:IS30 family transposase [Spirochaetales bacterium]